MKVKGDFKCFNNLSKKGRFKGDNCQTFSGVLLCTDYGPTEIIDQHWVIAHILVSAFGSPICADIKTVFKVGKNAWTSDLKLHNDVVCSPLLFNLK